MIVVVMYFGLVPALLGQGDFDRLRKIVRADRVAYVNRLIDRLDGSRADEHYAAATAAFVTMYRLLATNATPEEFDELDKTADNLIELSAAERWGADDKTRITKWLTRNKTALASIRAATDARRLASKLSSAESLLSSVGPPSGIYQFAELAAIQANELALRGEWRAAYAWNARIHRMADHWLQQPFLIQRMLGLSLERRACIQLLAFFQRDLPSGAAAILQVVHDGDELRCPASVCDEAETLYTLDYIESWYAWLDDPKSESVAESMVDLFFGANRGLLEDFTDMMPGTQAVPFKSAKELRAALRRSSVEHEWQVYRRLAGITSQWNAAPFAQAWKKADAYHAEYCEIASEAPALSLSACTVVPPSQFRYVSATNTCYRAAVDSVGLLLQYRERHEKWPKSLEALTPEFAKRLPIDPFSGKPLMYHLSADGRTFTLYSVAGNQIDDAGRHGEHWRSDGDWVFWPRPVSKVAK